MPSCPHSSFELVINRAKIDLSSLSHLCSMGYQFVPGMHYWYDNQSGAYGLVGGPALGFLQAGLNLGGTLGSDVSNGTTEIFVNGRHIHVQDLSNFQRIGFFPSPGRWWLDGSGVFGQEGKAPMGTLQLRSMARGRVEGLRTTINSPASPTAVTDKFSFATL
eukprot:CAMPEP_0196662464 /NCGR_PEP_ID=MMETSP1086-20130531/48828_1 /TAXON_ID=77921 /ORGANISM="Cyanoptyche  gloeocystis , Strain SAG4.97" /LENGTH=161 /DNA_ID=CAMNT_0041997863 /DNA_START=192 /DNA_END=677 /DNA_ORIENTATION=-